MFELFELKKNYEWDLFAFIHFSKFECMVLKGLNFVTMIILYVNFLVHVYMLHNVNFFSSFCDFMGPPTSNGKANYINSYRIIFFKLLGNFYLNHQIHHHQNL